MKINNKLYIDFSQSDQAFISQFHHKSFKYLFVREFHQALFHICTLFALGIV